MHTSDAGMRSRSSWSEDVAVETEAIDAVEREFRQRTLASGEHAERARRTIPGGSPSHATAYRPYQVVLAKASGPRVWDLDENQYYDLHNRFTTLVHGHRYPPVVEAIEAVAQRVGTGPIGPSEEALQLGELITSRIRSIDKIAFCNSGTEAGMLAARLARDVTGRSLIVKAQTGFHGWYEDLLVGRLPERPSDTDRTLLMSYGDATGLLDLLERRGRDIAAVFVEPILGAGGILGVSDSFHRAVLAATRRAGALFVADEVITIRLAEGGGQASIGIDPDLTMLGKIIGGGLPIGALGGRGELLDRLDPEAADGTPLFGTFNANPLSCLAGYVALTHLDQRVIDRMGEESLVLTDRLLSHAEALGVPLCMTRSGSLMNLYFSRRPPSPTESRDATTVCSLFHLICLNHGLVMYPRGTLCLSSVMTPDVLSDIADRLTASLDRLSQVLS